MKHIATVYQFKGTKERQEDSYILAPPLNFKNKSLCILGVTDGTSTSYKSDQAAMVSTLAFFKTFFDEAKTDKNLENMEEISKKAFSWLNNKIIRTRKLQKAEGIPEDHLAAAVGTFLAVDSARNACIVHAGDSAAFLEYNGTYHRLTEEHTEASDPDNTNEFTSFMGQAVTRFLGKTGVIPEIKSGTLMPGSSLWLVTDGILQGYANNKGEEENLSEFLQRAKEEDFNDNATAIHFS